MSLFTATHSHYNNQLTASPLRCYVIHTIDAARHRGQGRQKQHTSEQQGMPLLLGATRLL